MSREWTIVRVAVEHELTSELRCRKLGKMPEVYALPLVYDEVTIPYVIRVVVRLDDAVE